ncbi:MAG TPA: DUF559 domain-containing protein, partial [Acidimicrobiales bacterium]|nr:DUF559 domain-containing protein [Acidimicrobiales bacterium]
TAAGRTLTDLGTVAGALLVERAAESAIRLGLVTDHELRRRAGLPRRGVGVLRSVMALRPDGAPPTGSDLETRMLQLCRGRLPEPVRQLPVALMGASYRIDMSWPVWGVAVELDGREWHGPEVFDADRRRQNRMVVAGWVVLRFTWADVVTSPDATVRTLATVLRQRGCPGLEAACA